MTTINTRPSAKSQRMRLHYLPFHAVEPGMILGEGITLTERTIVRFSLPAGHELTAGNLEQLAAHGAEFVCIARPDLRSEAEIEADTAAATAKVLRIFVGADLANPVMADLFDRVLAYRSR